MRGLQVEKLNFLDFLKIIEIKKTDDFFPPQIYAFLEESVKPHSSILVNVFAFSSNRAEFRCCYLTMCFLGTNTSLEVYWNKAKL